MKIYYLENNRVLVDFKRPAPLVSIPIEMWNDGLNEFKGVWVSCCYTKTYTEKDRVLFTIYRSDTIANSHTSDGETIEVYNGCPYVISMLNELNAENNVGKETIKSELKKGKLNLFYGTKDTTGEHWNEFCCMLNHKDSITSDLGNSYREINWEDPRCWWEFHIYDERVRTKGHRPIPCYTEDIVDSL